MFNTEMGFRLRTTDQSMREAGGKERRTEGAGSNTQTEMSLKATSRMIEPTVMAPMNTLMDSGTRASGGMTSNMDMAAKSLLTLLNLQGLTRKERRVALASSSGRTEQATKVSGITTP